MNEPKVLHPGVGLLSIIQKLGITIEQAEKMAGVLEFELSRIINFKSPITAATAVRIAHSISNGIVDDASWLLAQANYDLAQARSEYDDELNARLWAAWNVEAPAAGAVISPEQVEKWKNEANARVWANAARRAVAEEMRRADR